jgi:hypothetical protein
MELITLHEIFKANGQKFPFKIKYHGLDHYKDIVFEITGKDEFDHWLHNKPKGSHGKYFGSGSESAFEWIKDTSMNTLHSLKYIIDNYKLPVRVSKLEDNGVNVGSFGLNSYHNFGAEVTITRVELQYAHFLEGGIIGITSVHGKNGWTVIDGQLKDGIIEHIASIPIPEPIKLTPEQEKAKEELQVVVVENKIRLAIFSRTLKPVQEKDVETIIDNVYNNKSGDKLTSERLDTLILESVNNLYGEKNEAVSA